MEEFFVFVLVIVLIIMLIKSHRDIKQLKEQISFLDGKVRDLYDKAFYNYEQIKKLKTGDIHEKNTGADTRDSNVNSQPQQTFNPYRQTIYYKNVSISSANTQSSVFNDNAQNAPKTFVSGNSSNKTNITQTTLVNMNTPANSDVSKQNDKAQTSRAAADNSNSAQSAQSSQINTNNKQPAEGIQNNTKNVQSAEGISNNAGNVQSANGSPQAPNFQNVQTFRGTAPAVKHDPSKQFRSFENWLGTRLFNVVASLMIFIGLIMFCTLGYEYITDTMKMAAMFVVSGSFIGLGAFFTKRNKSVFSLGLTGCGFGAFFISILLSHVYFHALTDVTAFSLVLVWAVLALFLSKKLDSVMLSVTAHMGTAVSVFCAFAFGFSPENIILPVVYQLVSIAVIVIGNIFCCKKTYRFGLFMSLLLLVYDSVGMCAAFIDSSVMPGKVSPLLTTSLFAVQFVIISFVSYLISVSTAALKTEKPELKNLDLIMFYAHFSNKILWSSGIVVSIGIVTGFTVKNVFSIDTLVFPTLAVCAAALGHVFITLIMNEKLGFNDRLSRISVWTNSGVITLALFVQGIDREFLPGMSFLFVYIAIIMAIISHTKNRQLNSLVRFLLGCEMVYMTLYGYFKAENVILSIVYMVIIGIEILMHWFMQTGESRERRFTFFKMAEYLWLSVSIIPINVSEFSDISFPLILSEFALMNIIAYLCKYGRDNEPELKAAVKIESLLTVYISIIALTSNIIGGLGNILPIKIVFVILSMCLTALYIKAFALSKSTALQVFSAATLSGYITAFFIGFSESIDFADLYVNVLGCKPFFFISAATLALIYNYNKNHDLRAFIWSAIGIDAFLMIFFGYYDLISEYYDNLPLGIIMVILSAAHAASEGLILYFTWKNQDDSNQKITVNISKTVGYFYINLAVFAIFQSIERFDIFFNNDELVLLGVTLANVILYIIEYNRSGRILYRIITICTNILLYFNIIFINNQINFAHYIKLKDAVSDYAIRIALILLSVGLYYLISREIIKTKNVIIQAYIGLTATLIVNASCRGLSDMFDIQYIFSIVTMITALVCIGAGFAAKKKGLRIYGLIIVMLCVIKLVTFDISAADSMSRVIAFIVGGIVCFAISGIYNKVENKLLTANDNEIII